MAPYASKSMLTIIGSPLGWTVPLQGVILNWLTLSSSGSAWPFPGGFLASGFFSGAFLAFGSAFASASASSLL